MKRTIILCLILAITLLAGCRSPKQTPTKPTPPQPECNCGYRWLETTFSTTVSGVSVTGIIRTSCDSVIWVSVNKVIEMGRMKLTPDSATVFVKILNKAYRGTYNDLYRQTKYRTSFDEIQKKIDDAYRNNKKQITFDINATQLKETIVLDIRRMEPSPAPLHYPLKMPANVKWIKL